MRSGVWVCVALGLLAGGCPSGWVAEDSGVDVDLHGVWALDGETALAVGQGGTVLLRQDGAWRALRSGTERDLYGVWGTAADHAVIVGDDGTALQWDGFMDPVDPPPPEPPPDLRVLGVDSPSDLRAIDGRSAGSALVGAMGPLQRYDGSGLRDGSACGVQRIGVCLTQDEAFAVGPPVLDEDGAVVHGGLCHSVGEGWSRLDPVACPVELEAGVCPLSNEQLDHPILWGVWVGPSGQGVVVGSAGAIWTYPPPEGAPWLPLPSRLATDFRAVDGFERGGEGEGASFEAYAVGDYGVAVRVRGDRVSGEPIDVSDHLRGVSVAPGGGHVFVVGARGAIFHLYR